MLESRWGRRAGPGVVALAALLAIASTTLGAPAVEGRPPPACPPGASLPAVAGDGPPAWFRLDPVLLDGTLVGQRLETGRIDGPTWTIPLDPEAFATGPTNGAIVLGTDDGRRSTVSIVDTTAGCVLPVATSSESIVRQALLDPDGRGVVEHRIRRADRGDLGIWHRPFGSEAPTRLLDPIAADPVFGRTWSTDLAWSDDGRSLAVATCGEVACRLRALSLETGEVRSVRDPRYGPLVGFVDDRIVVRGACRGLPCPVIAVDPRDGSERVLAGAAGLAVVVERGDGTASVVHEGATDASVRAVTVDARDASITLSVKPEHGLLSPFGGSGVELPPGWFGLGRDGRLPDLPAEDAFAERLADGSSRRLDEVSP